MKVRAVVILATVQRFLHSQSHMPIYNLLQLSELCSVNTSVRLSLDPVNSFSSDYMLISRKRNKISGMSLVYGCQFFRLVVCLWGDDDTSL